MGGYRIIPKRIFQEDLDEVVRRDSVLGERVKRRIEKLGVNPKHHGYHAGGTIRCNWVAGVGDWAIVYEVDDSNCAVVLLRFLSLDDV